MQALFGSFCRLSPKLAGLADVNGQSREVQAMRTDTADVTEIEIVHEDQNHVRAFGGVSQTEAPSADANRIVIAAPVNTARYLCVSRNL
jgi:hypothetical protein